MVKNAQILLLLLLLAGLQACKKENESKEPVPVDSVAELAAMNQTIGWNIFKQEQLAKPDENILISPFSIQTALNMATNGAQGNTQAEILDLLNCDGCALSDLNRLHQDLTTLLTEQSGHPTLTLANRFFYDPARVSVKAPFIGILADRYDCGADPADFSAQQAALDEINAWVKTNTNGKIDKILDNINALDVAFLINALHFKADWAIGFAPKNTGQQAFTKADGSEVQVDFVNADRNFTFARTAQYELVDIPFRDSTFSLSFIQPGAANADASWSRNITAASWNAMYDSIRYSRAIVGFPKLKLAYENDLINSLKVLGMRDAFSETAADFSSLGTASGTIFISQIKHKAVLEVDEKGAEGAAVTSIGFSQTSLPPVFWFDQPFVLALRHIPTNTLIFTGYVANPAF